MKQYDCIFCYSYNKKEDSFASVEAGKSDMYHTRYITGKKDCKMKKLVQTGIIIAGNTALLFTFTNTSNEYPDKPNPGEHHISRCSNAKEPVKKHVMGENNAIRERLKRGNSKGK